jgi:type IV pilus assembly protein PilE
MTPCPSAARPTRGLTLIELLIALAVAGILAAVAFPSYQGYMRSAYRAEARTALMEAAQWMERHFSMTQSYAVSSQGGAINDAALTAANLAVTPRSGTPRYNLSFAAGPTASTYTLQAVPTGAQASDTVCGTLTLTNLQVRGISGTGQVSDCWSR